MSMMAYGYLKGQKSGDIKGSVLQKGREDSIAIIAVSHAIVAPRDPQSALPTGQRMHKPFVFTKEVDKASPLLYNLLCTNENITKAIFKFWTPQVKAVSGVGAEVQHFTIELDNANIAAIDFRMANIRNPELVRYAEYEEISLTYQKITWTWNDGGITATDDWLARN
jgi:type VI secretion system secreted protein Hcp